MKIAIVLGTRPEIIKLFPVIREYVEQNIEHCIIHTGQHYSHDLDGIFFAELGIPHPDYNLGTGNRPHNSQIGAMISHLGIVLDKEKPDVVLVLGDTNTVLSGAIAASKLHIKIGHIEAGLRSHNRHMPEEINRILTDHCSDLLFATTELAKKNLLVEGIDRDKIFVTGNTIVDTLYAVRGKAGKESLHGKPYALATIHRTENVDSRERFTAILDCLKMVNDILPVVYPIHPHAKMRADDYRLDLRFIEVVSPAGYLEFINLESNADIVLTDSGGVQEEACILQVPCVTLRDETERPETVDVGANVVAGVCPERVVECVRKMMDAERKWDNPFGDGRSGKRIVEIIKGEIV